MQTTNTVVMVKPTQFGFNEDTAEDNEFQNKSDMTASQVIELALNEFSNAVDLIRQRGIEVLVLEENPSLEKTPDAVFPNNWFSTDKNGSLYIYPMAAENRAAEVRIDDLKSLLKQNGFNIQEVVDFRSIANQAALEGTGSLVFDHQNRKAYLAQSQRSDLGLATRACEKLGYELLSFTSKSSERVDFYHTNVIMSIGTKWAVVCLESILDPEEKATIQESLSESGLEVVDISLKQAQEYFCANILEVKNDEERSIIIMSSSAVAGLELEQKRILEASSEILAIDVSTIENVGGGSMRCMLAEVFLPYSN